MPAPAETALTMSLLACQDITSKKVTMDKFIRLQGDYEAIIQSRSPLVPAIFAVDDNACCAEWNAAMEILTGWMRHEVIGRTLPGDIFGGLCRHKGQETLTKFSVLLYQAITMGDTDHFPFGFFDKKGNFVEVLLTTSKRLDSSGKVFGGFCFLQVVSPKTKPAIEEAPREDSEFSRKVKELAYVRQEMKNALNGICFIRRLLENTATTENQKQVLETSDACERQMMTIISDMGLSTIDKGSMDLNFNEFILASVLDVVISQVMIPLREKNLRMLHKIPEEIKSLSLYGDQARLQLVLLEFLENIVQHTSFPDGWVEIKILPGLKLIQDRSEIVRLQFRMTHSGKGLQSSLIQEMFEDRNNATSQEGVCLNLSRKLLSKMNGQVHYIREQSKCYFIVDLEMTSKLDKRKVLPDGMSI
ncbi:hypothetical protein MLD38_039961 [Melastoma candidum]|uniref:Uncharacterized protein n=1 Tax=Melastoma candidum TaxID=119954 RepID=A0ACB9L586_9MYRT|nr:hypothetical protein MLD38_039961 [Melastoma candidum]